jgi:outer membrane protein assembly factor BamB
MASRYLLAGALCAAALSFTQLSAQEWTRFRGPNGAGTSEATTVPTTWTEADYNWRITLPGVGHSAPVIWGDRIFITSADESTALRHVLCLAVSDGHEIWRRDFPSEVHEKHARNSFASSTPAIDADRVYLCWSTPEQYSVLALDHDGHDVWQRDLGPFASQHSSGASLVVYEDLLLVNNEQDGPSFLLAVDCATGEDRWKTPRTPNMVSYATPCEYVGADGKKQLIFLSTAHGATGQDPTTGETLWEVNCFKLRTCSSPVVFGDLILGSCGSGQGGNYVVGVRPAVGDQPAEEVFRVEGKVNYVPTPVTNGPLAFLWEDKGVITCIANDGKILWRDRVDGNFSGSPIRVGQHLYCLAEDGDCFVVEAAPKFNLVARIPTGETSRSTPSVADGILYLRTDSHLISLGGR